MSVLIRTQLTTEFKEFLNVGIVRRREGRYLEALEHYEAGRDLIDSELAEIKYLIGIGNVRERLGKVDVAWTDYQRALRLAKIIEDKAEQGIVENNVAFLLINLNRFEEAHTWLDKAEESFRLAKDKINLAQTQETRASLEAKEFAYRRSVKSVCESILTLIDWIEQRPLLESLATAEKSIRAYRIQLTLETEGTVAKAAKVLGMSRQNLNRILKEEFPELEAYAIRGEPRGIHKREK